MLVFDFDQFGSIFGGETRFGDDGGDRLALKADLVDWAWSNLRWFDQRRGRFR